MLNLLKNKVILIYYVFITIMYDLFLSSWQFINSMLIKCGWFGLEEIFDSLTDLLFRIKSFSIQKVLQGTEKVIVCWGKIRGIRWVVKLGSKSSKFKNFFLNWFCCMVMYCYVKEWCFCDWWVIDDAFNRVFLSLFVAVKCMYPQ